MLTLNKTFGYVGNIEEEALNNEFFRKVIYTARFSQLVVMSLNPDEEIGEEVHTLDQFIRIEKGTGKAILNGEEIELKDGSSVVVPAGTRHNIVNISSVEKMKLYTVYSPPQHKIGTIHKTKGDAMLDEEDHFDA